MFPYWLLLVNVLFESTLGWHQSIRYDYQIEGRVFLNVVKVQLIFRSFHGRYHDCFSLFVRSHFSLVADSLTI